MSPASAEADRRFMRQALRLAERGRGTTRPNPVVGAVLTRNGRLVASGWHERAGGPHAEIVALSAAGAATRGATLYVTLEPCRHTGRTGPCTEAVIAAGIARVVVGCLDENPLVAGGGVKRLRAAGIAVDIGVLEAECRAANRSFFRWIRDRRPLVTLKAAATLDGFIAPSRAPRKPGIHWITGEEARAAAHELRARHDAILVGVGTVLADDPRLSVRTTSPRGRARRGTRKTGITQPVRVVLDGSLRTPRQAQLLTDREGGPVLLVAADHARKPPAERTRFERRRAILEAAGAEVAILRAGRDGRLPIARVLTLLGARGLQSLLVEGGSRVHGAFVAARLVDEVAVFFAPRLQGSGTPLAAGPPLPWNAPLRLGPLRVQAFSGDILVTADVLSGPPART